MTKGKITCSACSHVFVVPANARAAICPKCGQALPVFAMSIEPAQIPIKRKRVGTIHGIGLNPSVPTTSGQIGCSKPNSPPLMSARADLPKEDSNLDDKTFQMESPPRMDDSKEVTGLDLPKQISGPPIDMSMFEGEQTELSKSPAKGQAKPQRSAGLTNRLPPILPTRESKSKPDSFGSPDAVRPGPPPVLPPTPVPNSFESPDAVRPGPPPVLPPTPVPAPFESPDVTGAAPPIPSNQPDDPILIMPTMDERKGGSDAQTSSDSYYDVEQSVRIQALDQAISDIIDDDHASRSPIPLSPSPNVPSGLPLHPAGGDPSTPGPSNTGHPVVTPGALPMAVESEPMANTVITNKSSSPSPSIELPSMATAGPMASPPRSSPLQKANPRRAPNGITGGEIQRPDATKNLPDSGVMVSIPETPVEEVQMGQDQPIAESALAPIKSSEVLAPITSHKKRSAAGHGVAVKKEALAKTNWPAILLILGISVLAVASGSFLLYWIIY